MRRRSLHALPASLLLGVLVPLTGPARPAVALTCAGAVPGGRPPASAALPCAPAGAASPAPAPPGQFAPPPDPAAARAAVADDPVADSRRDLAATSSDLSRLKPRIDALQMQIQVDQERLQGLNASVRTDEVSLEHWMRDRFEQGDPADLLGYIMSGDGIRSMFDRRQAVNAVIARGRYLVTTAREDRERAARTAARSISRLAELEIARHREETLKVLAASETERLAVAAAASGPPSETSMAQLLASYQSMLATIAAARQNHTVYPAAGGGPFSVDTDLTQPSGETADTLDAFLSGTPLHDLGSAYVGAEERYHVNARYLVAHSILESAFGHSLLAVDKHNLFGFGADDLHPYEHARSFPDLATCIDVVARSIATDYLSLSGISYAGSTLRGMNVHYASDPGWARKIARIARTIP